MPRALTGIRASGNLHIGNYLGAIKPALALQQDYQCLFFIADLHALTTNRDGALLYSQSLDIAAAWIALGLDTEKHILYRQSDVAIVTELAWYLSCVTGLGLLEKSHAYKDALSEQRDISHAVFSYPVLMAADILLFEADLVPVGKDQKQHVEMARDMAGSLNAAYNQPLLKLPQPRIEESVMTIPGLDGRKMSKSYGNEIALFCDQKTLRKKILSIKTDSSDLDAPKELKGTLISDLLIPFCSKQQYKDLEARLAQGGLGWGHAKQELFEIIDSAISPYREKYFALRADESKLEDILAAGADKALSIALPVIKRVRRALGASSMARSKF